MTRTYVPNLDQSLRREIERVSDVIFTSVTKFGDKSMRGSYYTHSERLAVLAEEFGEVSKEVNTQLRNLSGIDPLKHGEFTEEALAKELRDVAAVALAWLARLDEISRGETPLLREPTP